MFFFKLSRYPRLRGPDFLPGGVRAVETSISGGRMVKKRGRRFVHEEKQRTADGL